MHTIIRSTMSSYLEFAILFRNSESKMALLKTMLNIAKADGFHLRLRLEREGANICRK